MPFPIIWNNGKVLVVFIFITLPMEEPGLLIVENSVAADAAGTQCNIRGTLRHEHKG